MKEKWKRIILIVIGLFILSFSSIAMADTTSDRFMNAVLPKLQGTWYDIKGNPALVFDGNTMNGCNIVGIYNVAGGVSNFSMTMRIVEKTGYRDLKMDCNNLNADPNTYHQVLYYDQQAYRRTQQPLYHETVGGLGLGMSEQDVKAKYGNPDVAHTYSTLVYKSKFQANFTDDLLTKVGLPYNLHGVDDTPEMKELKQGMTMEEVVKNMASLLLVVVGPHGNIIK